MRKLILLAVLGLGFFAAAAQTPTTQKIGYADVDAIFVQMPEFKQIETELNSTQKLLRGQIDAKAQEFQKKYADYQANLNNMLDAVRQNTERELTQMQQNLEKLQQDAQTTIQNKEKTMMAPVYEKVGKAITDVAKENGFSMILTGQLGGMDVVLYADEKSDISELVLKKLGVTPKPATPATNTPK